MVASSYCSMFHDEALGSAVDTIVSQVHPVIIICYGMRTRNTSSWSCFPPCEGQKEASAYDLLIVVQDNSRSNDQAVQRVVERINTDGLNITAVVHDIRGVHEGIKCGSYFFNRACFEGKKLYCPGPVTFACRKVETDRLPSIDAHWNKWFTLSRKFLKGASHYLEDGWPDLAVFMLHQAVEHVAIALIRVYLGYRPATHNLKRLVALTENFTPCLANVFLNKSKEEAELFNALCKAYSDVRYTDDYSIPARWVSVLFERVTNVIDLSEILFSDFRQRFIQNIVPSSTINQ